MIISLIRITLTAAIVASLLGSSPAQNEQNSKYSRVAYVPSGFLKAGDFLKLSPEMKEGYAIGYLNGIFNSTMLGADEEIVRAFAGCVKDMDSGQIAAIM